MKKNACALMLILVALPPVSCVLASEMVTRQLFTPARERGAVINEGIGKSFQAERMRQTLSFTGVIISASVKYAMIRNRRLELDEKARALYREGEVVQGMTLKKIGSNYVILANRKGDVKLRLYEGSNSRSGPPLESKPPGHPAPARMAVENGKNATPSTTSTGSAQAPSGAAVGTPRRLLQAGEIRPLPSDPFLDAIKKAKVK